MIRRILIGVLFVFPVLALAQGGGHVGRQQQQQQQQMFEVTKYSVVRGEDAENLYLALLVAGLPEKDHSEFCTEPVKVISGVVRDRVTTCFDRGENYGRARYKCFIAKEKRFFSKTLAEIVERTARAPGLCGGDGIIEILEE